MQAFREGPFKFYRFAANELPANQRRHSARRRCARLLFQFVNQLLEVTDMTLGNEFAKIGLGISCVVKEFVAEELKNGTLIEIPLELPIPKRVIGFAYHYAEESETLREFLEFCK